MFAAYARRWIFAEFRVAVVKHFVAQNIWVGEVITANPQAEIAIDNIVKNNRRCPVLNIGPSEIALRHGAILVVIDNMVADAGTADVTHQAVGNYRAGAPHVQAMSMTGHMMVLGGQILDREAVDDGLSSNARIKIKHAVFGRRCSGTVYDGAKRTARELKHCTF